MDEETQKLIAELSSKHGLKETDLMPHLGIKYKSGKYLFQDNYYETYIEALKVADHPYVNPDEPTTKKIKPNWSEYIRFLFVWLILGFFFTFGPYLMDGIGRYAGAISLYASLLLWATGPLTGYLYYIHQEEPLKKYSKWCFIIWACLTVWIFLSPTIIDGRL